MIENISSSDKLSLDLRPVKDLIAESTGIFRTQGRAAKKARELGWKHEDVICFHFPLGHLFVVGQKDFQPDEVAGITIDVYRFPIGYKNNEMQVLNLRKIRN